MLTGVSWQGTKVHRGYAQAKILTILAVAGLHRQRSVVGRVGSDHGQDFKAQARSGVPVPGYHLQVVISAGGTPVEAKIFTFGCAPAKKFEGRLVCQVDPGRALSRPGT